MSVFDVLRERPSRDHEVSLGETPRRMALLAAVGVVLGVVGGVAAFLIIRFVGLISNLALLHRFGWNLPNLSHYHPGPELIGVAVGGALIVALLAAWAPTIRGHGIPEALEAIIFNRSRIRPRVAFAKPFSAAITMGTGGPFGAEGPIIVTGASTGSLIGQVLKLSAAERRIVLAVGAAAGMSGVFATPIAAIVLAFELLVLERSLRSLLPLLLATGIATEIHFQLIGPHPLFLALGLHAVSDVQLPIFVAVGVACGALAIVLNKGLFFFEGLFRASRIPDFFHPLVGAVAFACIGFAYPGSLSLGYWAISDAVNNRFLLGAAAVMFVAKLFSWWFALASNTSGGTLAPIFIVSATMGEMMGIGLDHLFPTLHIQPAAFAIVAMGATFGAAARSLLTGAVFAVEVTGAYHLIVPMIITVAIAELVTHQFLDQRLMTDKLVRRGFQVEFDAQVDPFRVGSVGAMAEPIPPGLPLDDTLPRLRHTAFLRDAVVLFVSGHADAVVVEKDGAPIGLVYKTAIDDALQQRFNNWEPEEPTLLRWARPERRARKVPAEGRAASTGPGEPPAQHTLPGEPPAQRTGPAEPPAQHTGASSSGSAPPSS